MFAGCALSVGSSTMVDAELRRARSPAHCEARVQISASKSLSAFDVPKSLFMSDDCFTPPAHDVSSHHLSSHHQHQQQQHHHHHPHGSQGPGQLHRSLSNEIKDEIDATREAQESFARAGVAIAARRGSNAHNNNGGDAANVGAGEGDAGEDDPTANASSNSSSGRKLRARSFKVAVRGSDDEIQPKPVPRGRRGSNAPVAVRKLVSGKSSIRTTSEFRGVTHHCRTGRYEAHIWDGGKQVYLGGFESEEQAALAYDLAAIKCRGRDAVTNYPMQKYAQELARVDEITKEELVQSLRKQSKGYHVNSSKYRGVTKHQKGKWEARIGQVVGKRYKYLGLFTSETEAAVAYDRAAVEAKRLHAVTNFDISNYTDLLTEEEKVQVREAMIQKQEAREKEARARLARPGAPHDWTHHFRTQASNAAAAARAAQQQQEQDEEASGAAAAPIGIKRQSAPAPLSQAPNARDIMFDAPLPGSRAHTQAMRQQRPQHEQPEVDLDMMDMWNRRVTEPPLSRHSAPIQSRSQRASLDMSALRDAQLQRSSEEDALRLTPRDLKRHRLGCQRDQRHSEVIMRDVPREEAHNAMLSSRSLPGSYDQFSSLQASSKALQIPPLHMDALLHGSMSSSRGDERPMFSRDSHSNNHHHNNNNNASNMSMSASMGRSSSAAWRDREHAAQMERISRCSYGTGNGHSHGNGGGGGGGDMPQYMQDLERHCASVSGGGMMNLSSDSHLRSTQQALSMLDAHGGVGALGTTADELHSLERLLGDGPPSPTGRGARDHHSFF